MTKNEKAKVRANWSWIVYKYLGVKRKIPCGRTKRDSYLCCLLNPDDKNSYIVKLENGSEELRCKVCDSCHILSSTHIDMNNLWF